MARAWAFLRVLFNVRNDPMNGDNMLISGRFWKQTVERSVKTAAQFGLVFLGADAFNILETDLVTAGGYALAGAIVSVLTSIASAPFAEEGTPSMVDQDR